MAGFYSLENKEVIRIKVKEDGGGCTGGRYPTGLLLSQKDYKKCDGMMKPEYKKFSIDPQITSFEMLQGILAKAFEIKSDFTLSYLAKDAEGQEVYLSMLSDWDMDAAFQCAADPCLKLKVDLKPFDQELDDWDVIAPAEIPQARISSLLDKNSLLGAITSNISTHVGKTMTSMQRAMGFRQSDDPFKPLKPPMSDMEFHNYLDSAGFMVKPSEFRLSIYQGGIEGSLRRVAWRHLLNIFPENMSGRERFDYLKRKEKEYYSLRDEWKERFAGGSTTEEVKYVASMVKKDVLRTDRSHRLYAGSDDNKNVLSLFHILVTYALTHPDVSYCQGMSDLASPLLVIQKDEAQAYICFCSLMSRLRGNFSPDGSAMMTQFRHLAELLQVNDPAFYEYLQGINAHDLFFCYRWLLLQLKREFPFEDALYMLEVMWSTLPPTPPETDLPLVDPDYNVKLLSSSPCSPTFSFQQSVYAKLLAMRCSNRARDLPLPVSNASDPPTTALPVQQPATSQGTTFDVSPADDDRGLDYPQIDDIMTRSLQQRSNSIDQVLQDCGSGNNSLTVPPQEYIRPQDGAKDSPSHRPKRSSRNSSPSRRRGRGSNNSSPTRGQERGSNKSSPIRVQQNGSESDSCRLNGELCEENSVSGQGDRMHENVDRLPSDHRSCPPEAYAASDSYLDQDGVCPTGACLIPHCAVSVSRDVAESAETNSSYANISIEVGTADLPNDVGPIPRKPSVQEGDKEMQFSLSLESNPASPGSDSDPVKKEGGAEDEGYSGFFGSMKKLLASPKKRPADIFIPREISSNQNSCSTNTSSREPTAGEGNLRRGHSDSGVSEGGVEGEQASGSWPTGLLQAPKPRPPPPSITLPPPQEFGNGNPFLMFLCFTLLLQHREQIMRTGMDYEDVAMFFDKMVRKHNVHKVLSQARELYTDYLRAQQALAERKANDDYGLSV